MNTDYTFRLRFTMAPREKLEINSPSLDLSGPYHPALILSSGHPNKPISKSKQLILRGSGHDSETEARETGERFRDALTLALSRLHIGVDLGDRGPRSVWTKAGLVMLESKFGRRVLNDVHGLMVFESDPPPKFVSVDVGLVRGTNEGKFINAFSLAAGEGFALTDRERLAYDVLSASYFERSQDARLLTLMMSFEVLVTPAPRAEDALRHVCRLIALTREASQLTQTEQASLLGSLRWLRRESIRQAGRRFARERLAGRKYMDMVAEKFFVYCYDIRSRLIHGTEPIPPRDVVSSAAANLESFVADILSGPLLGAAI